jgi:hypothetical protein
VNANRHISSYVTLVSDGSLSIHIIIWQSLLLFDALDLTIKIALTPLCKIFHKRSLVVSIAFSKVITLENQQGRLQILQNPGNGSILGDEIADGWYLPAGNCLRASHELTLRISLFVSKVPIPVVDIIWISLSFNCRILTHRAIFGCFELRKLTQATRFTW